MKHALACAALALLVPAGAAAQSRCTVAAFVPDSTAVPAAIAGDESLVRAVRLMGEGRANEARAALGAIADAPMSQRRERAALLESLLALVEATRGENEAAAPAAAKARALVDDATPASYAASVHLNVGWALTEAGSVRDTRAAFEAAAAAARRAGDRTLEATALTHLALLESRIAADVMPAARRARDALARVEDVRARARLGVALGLALVPEPREARRAGDMPALAHAVLSTAYADADAARDPILLAHALGLMGELQLVHGEPRAAAATLERAVSLSRSVADDPWRFRWSWKHGVALRAAGDNSRALDRLGEAVEILEAAKSRRAVGRFASSTLARDYRNAYYDLADALLSSPGGDKATLRRVRDTMELSRASEMEDFFSDPCIASRSAVVSSPEELDAGAVIVHPLLLDDRLEILVSHRSGIARFTSAHAAVEIGREVQRLRNALERPGSERWREPAARLHAWLVAPIEAHLAKVGAKTIVWVPDGALRGVPFAALHDGRSHLVERYAVAITPVAALTDPRKLSSTTLRASIAGLTIPAQGFDALPGVALELDTLSKILGVTPLRDERFSVAALTESLRRSPVNTMHIASHGQFAPEAGQTFLVAADGKLTLPQLREALSAGKLREEPLELIVLSACQTAAGDDKSALGLAGVAIGAGARSALATLWAVSDDSTTELTAAFYREALGGKASRAQALRDAQLVLLKDERHAHPFYWAPYVLIGNWM